MNDNEWINDVMIESRNELFKAMQSLFGMFREQLNQQEQATNVSTHTPEPSRRFNFIYDDDDDDEFLPEEDVPKENFKIYSNPLFEFDDEYISSDVNPLNEVLDDIENKDSYISNLDELALLVTPLSKLNEDDCFDPGGDFVLEDIEACPTSDSIPPGIDDADFDPKGDILYSRIIKSDVSMDFEDDYYDSVGDIIYLESLLIKDTIPNLPPEVFLDRDPKSLEDEPDKDDLKNIVKVFDPRIHEKIISPTNVRSEDTIFDPGISAFSFYSLEPVVSHRSGTFMESQARDSHKNKRFLGGNPCFYLLFLFSNKCDVRRLASSFLVFRGLCQDCPDYEDSRARGFVHRSLKLQSLACLLMGIRYPRSY
ncbi:ribonuclease H-like domain-containing protein [Tanacetum coccineum]|uniref:Ribonuclease H-like domain-containing protein n=1 Tax=Tanacetum coccineum TaxID=301880 RepID=A0ABQ4WC13_9ASTR